ncbi:excinuclease ABC subunit UvrB [Candidatus Micrarchaeota archaeon]|nr:excinuclease ABC subunit UvrB [Candidatus Micrarchaeota archaeon]
MALKFELKAPFSPTGDQPGAIAQLSEGVLKGERQTLLGVTGSGKTFSIASVIAKTGRNALIISHNKTLASQLYQEFLDFFPHNNVEYFVSYYDYYMPEAYIAATDMYVDKEVMVNEKLERLRFSSTASLMSGEPTVVVSSVSCIYGLGSPADYGEMSLPLRKGARISRGDLLRKLVSIQYERNDFAPTNGCVRAKGEIVDVFPSYKGVFYRLQFDGDRIEKISEHHQTSATLLRLAQNVRIFPAKHFVVPPERIGGAVKGIENELKEQLPKIAEGDESGLKAHRLRTRVNYDIEQIREFGFCKGVENYSRYFDGRKEGEKPYCLLDFFNDDSLLVIDESHQTIPQLHGMFNGDQSRKKSLVEYGFRLPSCLDNRPLKFSEFEKYLERRPSIFVSATPGDYERQTSARIVEQLVRPTGIVDPEISVRRIEGQVDDLLCEVRATTAKGCRTLVTTLTKRMAEDLAEFMMEKGIRVRYLHSEIDTLERTDIIRRLRLAEFDVLVGINLLREGLDIPEVGLVAILDADKEGFLRNSTSLIQTIGRAARNTQSRVIMYAERETHSMAEAIAETNRRRAYQKAYNAKHGITPRTIMKKVAESEDEKIISQVRSIPKSQVGREIIETETLMKKAAENLNFEKAIALRERLKALQMRMAG